jgi:N-acetylmuramoyl-L-alanine amidase
MTMRVIPRPSPNHSERNGAPVDTIVIHSTAGGLDGALSWLCNPASKVSAHYVIARSGDIYKLVPLARAAWHAGRCPNFPRANQRSVGIELEQLPGEPPTQKQLEALRWLVGEIRKQFNIQYIYGHHEINPRKSDPYQVDMDALRQVLM